MACVIAAARVRSLSVCDSFPLAKHRLGLRIEHDSGKIEVPRGLAEYRLARGSLGTILLILVRVESM